MAQTDVCGGDFRVDDWARSVQGYIKPGEPGRSETGLFWWEDLLKGLGNGSKVESRSSDGVRSATQFHINRLVEGR